MSCCGRWRFSAMSEYLLETEIPARGDRGRRAEDRGQKGNQRGVSHND
jgi:hypothetical protein